MRLRVSAEIEVARKLDRNFDLLPGNRARLGNTSILRRTPGMSQKQMRSETHTWCSVQQSGNAIRCVAVVGERTELSCYDWPRKANRDFSIAKS